MEPFAQVVEAEMFLTYAADEGAARAAFVDHGLPEGGRVRKQPARKASGFRYTLDGETVTATVIGSIPPDYQDDESTPVDPDAETPDVLNA